MDIFGYSLEKNQSNIQIQIYLFKISQCHIIFYSTGLLGTDLRGHQEKKK